MLTPGGLYKCPKYYHIGYYTQNIGEIFYINEISSKDFIMYTGNKIMHFENMLYEFLWKEKKIYINHHNALCLVNITNKK